MSPPPLYIHLFWHQHQPWYPAPGDGACSMPWVRLHGVKDYYDMAALAQQFEGWTQTINLVPSLLDQLEGYVQGAITDRAWELSRRSAAELTPDEKRYVLRRFFDAHLPRMIHPYPRYDELYRKRGPHVDAAVQQFSTQDLLDLQVWFNLVWIDPLWHEDPALPLHELIKKQGGFTEEEKQAVLDLQMEILKQIIPLHRRLYQEGKIEITCTPYYHPILPLLCNTDVARVSNPRDPLPDPPFVHPEDAAWQVREGLKRFEAILGFRATGMWPSEGSVSDEACACMAQEGLSYFATSQDILYLSTRAPQVSPLAPHDLYRIHRLATPHGEIDCIFRDQELSDCIGFHYANRDAKDAAGDFIARLKAKVQGWSNPVPPLVNVILDGENCWEFYPRDGHDFLKYLIEGILHDPQLHPTTLPAFRKDHPVAASTLKSIFPGSWIAHNYRIWIGHPEDNAAWHYLRRARELLAQEEHRLDPALAADAWKEIHIAEGSDWYWWFGDENSSAHDLLFDEAFRGHLARIYTLLQHPVPEELKRPIKRPKELEYRGCLLLHPPRLTGKRKGYYDWVGAQPIHSTPSTGAMHEAKREEQVLLFGRHENDLCFLLLFPEPISDSSPVFIQVQITNPVVRTVEIAPGGPHSFQVSRNAIEGVVHLDAIGLEMRQEAWLFFTVRGDGREEHSIPANSELYLQAYTAINVSPLLFL